MKNAIATFALAISAASAAVLSAAPTPAQAHDPTEGAPRGGAQLRETSTRVFDRELPNVPGKQLLAVEVSYPPGASTPSHKHPNSAFIYAYVLSGEIESGIDDEAPRIYKTGEGWYESPGTHHRVSRNASKTKSAKLLAIFVADSGTGELVFPDPK
jgi:quercetin dioxygenase-like cupin family protein